MKYHALRKFIAPGTRFGRLQVINFKELKIVGKKVKRKKAYYNCICDCGNKTIKESNNLQNGNSKSCGCLRIEVTTNRSTLPENTGLLPGFTRLLREYKRQAEYRGLTFSLTNNEFEKLTSSNCYYCGKEKSNISKSRYGSKRTEGYYIYNGIDRIDSSKGYETHNCIPCCIDCNTAKMALSQEEFLNLVRKIYENLKL